jgi:hypothetical protein
MKTASFSFVAKFPAKKVKDCFTNPAFAKLHTATKLFGKAGIIKTDKTTIVRAVPLTAADKLPVIAVINFTDADAGKSTAVEATFVNVPDDKVAFVKGLGKIISAEIAAFYAPKPKASAKKATKKPAAKKAKATAKKAPAKKAAAKKPAAKKVAAKKPVAEKAVKAPAKKTAKPATKKPAAKKAAAKKPAAKPVEKPAAKPADKPVVPPETPNPVKA